MMSDYTWMIYGATGCSGELIARKAVHRGLRPVLAGRNAETLQKLAAELNLSWRAFEVENWPRFRSEIARVNLLVNAAGPLLQTSVLVAESCLATYTHYFDLDNQIPSLVAIYTLDADAKERSLTLLPGLAFSPAASNCLVKHLHTLLPGSDSLDIAVDPFVKERIPGANLTIAENIVQGGFRRRGGVLERFCFGSGLMEAGLPTGVRRIVPSSLGDGEAAYRCTHLPNITSYMVTDIPAEYGSNHPNSPKQSLVWARISRLNHSSIEGWVQFGEGYGFTADLVVAAVSQFVNKSRLSAGVHTPATALGADFILELPNVVRTVRPIRLQNHSGSES